MIGQLAISRENNEHLMLTAAKSFLVFDRVDTLDTIRTRLDRITSAQLRDAANEVLDVKRMNQIIFE